MANRFLSNKVRNRNHIRMGTKNPTAPSPAPTVIRIASSARFRSDFQSTVNSEPEIAIIQHACIVRFRSICVCFRCDPICRNRLKRPCKIKTKASPNSSDKKRVFYRLDRFSYIARNEYRFVRTVKKRNTRNLLCSRHILSLPEEVKKNNPNPAGHQSPRDRRFRPKN